MEMTKVKPDRRKYSRLPMGHVIAVALVDEREQLVVSKDLSRGGIRFEAIGLDFELGQKLRVTFNVADRTIIATGRVAWAIDLDPITVEVGLEFLDIDPFDLERIRDELEPTAAL